MNTFFLYLSIDLTKFPKFILRNLIQDGNAAETLRKITDKIIIMGSPVGKKIGTK